MGWGDPSFHAQCLLPSTRLAHFTRKNKLLHKTISHKVETSYAHSLIISMYLFYPFTYDLIFLSSDSTANSH